MDTRTQLGAPTPREYDDPASFIASWGRFSRGGEPLPPSAVLPENEDLTFLNGLTSRVEIGIHTVIHNLDLDNPETGRGMLYHYVAHARRGTSSGYTLQRIVLDISEMFCESALSPEAQRLVNNHPEVADLRNTLLLLNRRAIEGVHRFCRRNVRFSLNWSLQHCVNQPDSVRRVNTSIFGDTSALDVCLALTARIVPIRCRTARSSVFGTPNTIQEMIRLMPPDFRTLGHALGWRVLTRWDLAWPHTSSARAVARTGEFPLLRNVRPIS